MVGAAAGAKSNIAIGTKICKNNNLSANGTILVDQLIFRWRGSVADFIDVDYIRDWGILVRIRVLEVGGDGNITIVGFRVDPIF